MQVGACERAANYAAIRAYVMCVGVWVYAYVHMYTYICIHMQVGACERAANYAAIRAGEHWGASAALYWRRHTLNRFFATSF